MRWRSLVPKLCLGTHDREALLPVQYQYGGDGAEHGKQSLQDLGSQAERLCKYWESDGGPNVGQAVPDGFSVRRYDETTAYVMTTDSAPVRHSLTYTRFEYLHSLVAWECRPRSLFENRLTYSAIAPALL